MGAFTHDGACAIAVNSFSTVDSVPWPLGSVPILDDAVDGIIAVGRRAVSCKRTLNKNVVLQSSKSTKLCTLQELESPHF